MAAVARVRWQLTAGGGVFSGLTIWCGLCTVQGFSSISIDAAKYYDCSEVMINTLVTVSNIAQITVALIWTMNLESTHGLQIPYVVGATLLVVGGWLSYYGATAAASPSPGIRILL